MAMLSAVDYHTSWQAEPNVALPPAFYEYSFYAVMTYAHLGQAWGLNVPSLGATALVLLAIACLIHVHTRMVEVFAPIWLALCCAIGVIAVQVYSHSEEPIDETTPFVTWLLMLVIVRTLSLRPRFLHRFALAAFGMGLLTLPFLSMDYGDGVLRASVRGTGLSNPNVLALWFGFCYVYFLVFSIQTTHLSVRILAVVVACGCLYVVGITVSRGALLGLAVASVTAFHRSLKQHFLPVLSLVIVSWIVFESGLFDQVTDAFFERGMQETGRGIIWPLVFERFLDSPWEGVGLAHIHTPLGLKAVYPHNGILYVALAAGIIPLAFFLAYLLRAAWMAFRTDANLFPDARFLPPLLALTFAEIMVADESFMSPWIIVVLTYAVSRDGGSGGVQIAAPAISRRGREGLWNRQASETG